MHKVWAVRGGEISLIPFFFAVYASVSSSKTKRMSLLQLAIENMHTVEGCIIRET